MKTLILIAVAGLMFAATPLFAQLPAAGSGFQQAGSLAAPGTVSIMVTPITRYSGKPYSATAVTHETQTYADGTHIDHTETSNIYFDAQGRERRDIPSSGGRGGETTGGGSITIHDPVEGVNYALDVNSKTAIKRTMPSSAMLAATPNPASASTSTASAGRGGYGDPPGKLGPPSNGAAITGWQRFSAIEVAKQQANGSPNTKVEDLGTQVVNGVQAEGVRVTTTIPVGKIGNDRDIITTNERWYSNDLQTLVKSVNTDQRFGTTTFELTNIVLGPPDPTVFQVPADYTITTPAGRGGRGGRGQ